MFSFLLLFFSLSPSPASTSRTYTTFFYSTTLLCWFLFHLSIVFDIVFKVGHLIYHYFWGTDFSCCHHLTLLDLNANDASNYIQVYNSNMKIWRLRLRILVNKWISKRSDINYYFYGCYNLIFFFRSSLLLFKREMGEKIIFDFTWRR